MRILSLFLAVLVLTQCGAPQPPVCRILPASSRIPTTDAMATARSNWNILSDTRRKAEWPAALTAYNNSIRILFDQMRCGTNDLASGAQRIGTAIAPPSGSNENVSAADAVFPSTSVKIRSKERHQLEPGIGIPTVTWKATSPVGVPRPAFYPPNGQSRNLTAVLDYSKNPPTWRFPKRWITNSISIGGTSHHLAADWTAPIDFFWYMCDLDDLRIQNVLLPERFTQETGLYFLEPYNPEKIPVVMVHGLVSSPDAYRDILNDLSPEPWFREKYQVWLYNYPTGTPWLYNAMRFRQIMGEASNYARTKGSDTNLKKMVILSHSMGGLLTRTAVSDPGTALYNTHFKLPFDQLEIKPESRTLIREGLLYDPLTDPKRVVFMAVPHRGSPMANFRGTAFISNLIRLPKTLTVGILDATLKVATEGLTSDAEVAKVRPPTSISSLSPNSRGFKGLAAMPLPSNITFHSIVGDKGHGDTPDSSDGVVPYWSSHVEPVASELVVDSNHSVPSNPEAADEIKRILRLHLETEGIPVQENETPLSIPNAP